MIHPGKICLGHFWEVMSLMKKAKNTAKSNMSPDSSALQGLPTKDPHEDFVKKDANFKKQRGAQK